MANAADHPLIQSVRPLAPEDLAGDLIQAGHRLFGVIWVNAARLGGTPCFYGTRVPIKNLFDYIESGYSIDEFLNDFDGISEEQTHAVIEIAQAGLLQGLSIP